MNTTSGALLMHTKPYLSILGYPHSLLGCKQSQMRERYTGAVIKVNEAPHLILFIFHESFVRHAVDLKHVGVLVFVRVKYTWKRTQIFNQ